MIGLRIKAKDKESYITGTLLSRKDPRIVSIDGFNIEIVPEGELLYIHNNDKPGVIGNLGTLSVRTISISQGCT
jgi:D-3-phosphoglycerate dehydrogenase